jgi:hypothetical protein
LDDPDKHIETWEEGQIRRFNIVGILFFDRIVKIFFFWFGRAAKPKSVARQGRCADPYG